MSYNIAHILAVTQYIILSILCTIKQTYCNAIKIYHAEIVILNINYKCRKLENLCFTIGIKKCLYNMNRMLLRPT